MRQVTAAVIIEDGLLFLARRAPGQKLAGYWELPGGKVEPGETPEECLKRELMEELQMECRVCEFLGSVVHEYEHGGFELLAYRVERLSSWELRVHDAATFHPVGASSEIVLLPADITLLSDISAMTGARASEGHEHMPGADRRDSA